MKTLNELKGLGPKRLASLHEARIFSLSDLLDCLPKDYLYAQKPKPIVEATMGTVCIRANIDAPARLQYYAGRSTVRVLARDDSGTLPICWFNQPWMARNLQKNQSYTFYGKLQEYQGRLALINPKIIVKPGIHPVYQALPGLPGKVFESLIDQALIQLQTDPPETLPKALLQRKNLLPKLKAWRLAHQPGSLEDIALAKRRLAFETLLLFQLAISGAAMGEERGPVMSASRFIDADFWQALPFTPTTAQEGVLKQILLDMAGQKPMRRLVQGDVGSGKTAVAFGSALMAINNGYQCALMAPTELLARQHLANAEKLLEGFGVSTCLLLGGMPAKERRLALEGIAEGKHHLIIGTHALLGKGVSYHRLGLVITDEQHRFGVKQRQNLADKSGEISPHMLALSATPIPRSLALVLYGDLDVSIIDQLPPGRTPVHTRIVPEKKRQNLYDFMRRKAEMGEQSYLVCPLVEDSDEGDRASALGMFQHLKQGPLKGIPMALTYGSQKPTEKEENLDAFYAGEAKVLVSTTVVEVGMDVPNATCMVIEDADHFGLAQLHQLRGRVGRGNKESWCFLLGEDSERLNIISSSTDGFVIAEKDLELRGPGELLGTRQHGQMLNNYGINDLRLIEETSQYLADLKSDVKQQALYAELQKLARQKFAQHLADGGLH